MRVDFRVVCVRSLLHVRPGGISILLNRLPEADVNTNLLHYGNKKQITLKKKLEKQYPYLCLTPNVNAVLWTSHVQKPYDSPDGLVNGYDDGVLVYPKTDPRPEDFTI